MSKSNYVIAEMQGNLGNWIFGYMFSYVWAKEHNIENVYAKPEIPKFYQQIKYYNSLKDSIFRNINLVLNIPQNLNIYYPRFWFDKNEFPDMNLNKGIMFTGAVQYYPMYKNYRQDFIDIFGPTQEIKDEIVNLYGDLNNTIGFNIRLGDFVEHPIFWFYDKKEIDYILSTYCKDKKVIITSDNIEWCKENITHPQIIFADKQSDKFNKMVIDFYLNMQCGENIISAGSSFSWLCAWMNNVHGGKKVYCPEYWLKKVDELGKNSDCMVLDCWTKIKLENRHR